MMLLLLLVEVNANQVITKTPLYADAKIVVFAKHAQLN